MSDVTDALAQAALEAVASLLTHPDPMVRLETAFGIIDRGYTEEDVYAYRINDRDGNDLAELDEFDGDPQAHIQGLGGELKTVEQKVAEELEELDRKAAEQQALAERTPPAAERAGRSAIGSGEQRP